MTKWKNENDNAEAVLLWAHYEMFNVNIIVKVSHIVTLLSLEKTVILGTIEGSRERGRAVMGGIDS